MSIWQKMKHRFAKWIWRSNPWTKLVDRIEGICKDISKSEDGMIAGNFEVDMSAVISGRGDIFKITIESVSP